jgi:hypothetical protein
MNIYIIHLVLVYMPIIGDGLTFQIIKHVHMHVNQVILAHTFSLWDFDLASLY